MDVEPHDGIHQLGLGLVSTWKLCTVVGNLKTRYLDPGVERLHSTRGTPLMLRAVRREMLLLYDTVSTVNLTPTVVVPRFELRWHPSSQTISLLPYFRCLGAYNVYSVREETEVIFWKEAIVAAIISGHLFESPRGWCNRKIRRHSWSCDDWHVSRE